jgi:hypothetical protein
MTMPRTYYLIALLLVFCSCAKDRRAIVVSKIRQASKLATTETTIDKIVFGTSEKRLLGIIRLNKARFAAYSKAIIKTGIDLNKIKPDDIKIDGKRIDLTLPNVEVINFSYPFKHFKIDESITDDKFLNNIDIFDQEHFYRLAEMDIRNNLKYTGVIEATEQKTRLMMEGLLKNLGYEEIYVTFKKGELITEVDLSESETE